MKHIASASAALLLSTSLVSAAGLDRSGQSVNAIFADDNTLAFSFGFVQPNVKGEDDLGNSYDVGESYGQLQFSYTQQLNDQFAVSVILDQPYGADISYNNDPSTSRLGGTGADLSSESLGLIGKYQFNERFSVFGGVKMERVRANVQLNGQAYSEGFSLGPATDGFNDGISGFGLPAVSEEVFAGVLAGDTDATNTFNATYGGFGITSANVEAAFASANSAFFTAGGYDFDMEETVEPVYLIGAAYEIPDIALRFSATYHFETEHKAQTTENVFGITTKGDVEFVTPQSLNLDFQTGIAENTLLTASYRWTEFSAVDLIPDVLQSDLVNLDDGERYTLGVARRFNENWAGSATFIYEPEGDSDLVSPLGPTNGLQGLSLGAQYTNENVTLSGGINYSILGDAKAEVGGEAEAEFSGNSSFAFGFQAQVTF